MKQILQSLKSGHTKITDVPWPQMQAGQLLVRTHKSLLSSGTEKMLVDFGKAPWIDKARQQPEKVKMVIDKIKVDGLVPTIAAIRHQLDKLIPMGYCNVGTIVAVSEDVTGFAVGDRVISNGPHAEIVTVAKNLCCKVPDEVSDDEAAFAVLGAIALQGIRLAAPTLGENFVVIGLGLIGLLTVQLLQAHGCRVMAFDLDSEKMQLAAQWGAHTISVDEEIVAAANDFSRQRGVDGVLITATTKSNAPVHQAATMCRKRGRIVLVGVTGLELSRADFYEKELSFQVSCSYGPGRYDDQYEVAGHDYPIGFVRWTEQRNFEAFLDMLASKKIDVQSLISHRFSIEAAEEAYQLLSSHQKTLGILIEYPAQNVSLQTSNHYLVQLYPCPRAASDFPCVGMIGAGHYASRLLIPAFSKTKANLKIIACRKGTSGTLVGKKFGFAQVTTDTKHIFSDPEINAVVIASRHDNHADLVCQALAANKNVFVEKPLCLTLQELDNIVKQLQQTPQPLLMVGFNRRFAPHVIKIKDLLSTCTPPKSFIMTVNAGEIPADHWTQQAAIGGGRIIGEVCHFIDLLRSLAMSPIVSFHSTRLQNVPIKDDKISISLSFADGSFGVIHYLANGHRSFPKERLEIFVAGKILQLDNFRQLRGFGWSQFKKMNLWRQDKGQGACVQKFIDAVRLGTSAPVPLDEIIEVSRVTLEIAQS